MVIELHDLLWLLLPVAAASGWYAAQRDLKRRSNPSGRHAAAEYLRGVSYLINEQPDRAVEVFSRALDTEHGAVEMHLALGSLFRRRGEVERAISIHQKLVARGTLDEAQRTQARFELALDYQKAGLLDRAEVLFEELSHIPEHTVQALHSLVHIYEQEKDWIKASAAQRRLMRSTTQDHSNLLAHYQCELGEQAFQRGDHRSADEHARQAIVLDPRCVRARHLMGRVLATQGEDIRAISVWQEIELFDPEFMDEIVHEIVMAYRRIGNFTALRHYLETLMSRHPGVNSLLYLSETMRTSAGADKARRFLVDRMHKQPSSAGVERLLDLIRDSDTPASPDECLLIKSVMLDLMQKQKGYICTQCGYRGETLHWQCPACYGWITMHPASRIDAMKEKAPSKIALQPSLRRPVSEQA